MSALDKELIIGGKRVQLSNLDKIFWPEDNLTKGDMINYYIEIAPYILPYLKDRPLNLNRFPDGIEGGSFYQKNITSSPDWAELEAIHSESENKTIHQIICQDRATLIYLANLGNIEFNPWTSRIKSLDHPDYFLIDLDPVEIDFGAVVECALAFHEVLEKIQVPGFVKTSGATGLHIYLPAQAEYDYKEAQHFTHLLSIVVNKKLPEISSLERIPAKRRQKVYLDYLQNGRGKTLASAYSLRPRPKAPVSTPLLWSEVNNRLDPVKFNIHTLPARLKKHGDLWKGMAGSSFDLGKALKRLEPLME